MSFYTTEQSPYFNEQIIISEIEIQIAFQMLSLPSG
jgi:hypothetical protein